MTCNGLTLQRLEGWESDIVKYALESDDGSFSELTTPQEKKITMKLRLNAF